MDQANDSIIGCVNNQCAAKCFKSFFVRVFQMLNPGVEFWDNWHLDLVIEHLHNVENHKINRLVINVPPRTLKSTLISVAWVAWILGNNPEKKIIVASYSQTLSEKHSTDCKAIIESGWFKEIFPQFKLMKGNITKNKFVTQKHGFRFSTSVKGSLTGEGADIIIVDDPHSAGQASSLAHRCASLNWFDQTLSTRLNNKRKGAIIVVMQRLHQDDLTAHLVKKKVWHNLKIPAISGEDYVYKTHNRKFKFKAGQILHPSREDKREIDIARNELGSFAFNAQYMQNPISSNNILLQRNWIKRYDAVPQYECMIVQSWDCAFKVNDNNDYSVCSTWMVVDNSFYLLDVLRDKLQFCDLKKCVLEMAEKYDSHSILIEDKASGQSLIQELQRNTKLPIVAIIPVKDKESRFLSSLFFFESGKIFFPENANWLSAFEDELFEFPNSKHDDQVDSITQFLNWIRRYKKIATKIRVIR